MIPKLPLIEDMLFFERGRESELITRLSEISENNLILSSKLGTK